MTYEQIHNLFKQAYNQTNWKQFLGEAFANSRLLSKPEILTGIDSNVASQVQKLGYVVLNENGFERNIAVYEVTLAQGIILERNRVGLRNLLRKYWKDIDAAFIAYHRPETPTWRFTYVSELTGYDADGESIQIKTEPKRYTYILGEGESTRTAAERFATITNKGSKATLDDVKEAFSVEKLSKAFFDEYKKHYDVFCNFMISQPNIRQTLFNGDEKGIRDFSKKLLGRIVFLYFIQKKGWLGVPAKSEWGKGDLDFLTNQFKNYPNSELFYQQFLCPLFFETLNKYRENDMADFANFGIMPNQRGEEPQILKIPYLNGGLFEEDDKKHRNLIFPTLLFKNLFDFFNQYNFTIYEDDPNDHTVAVDPEMLGHIFENLLEDNKDKGAFYTPKEIVHYMCQESLIEYLTTWFENKGYEIVGYVSMGQERQPQFFPINEGRKGQMVLEIGNKSTSKQIDRILIEKLLKKKLDDNDKKLVKKHSTEFHNALDNVKICDPAIGSGAFPMGLLHEIFTAKQTLHTFEYGNTTTFDASAVKLNIIQNSIYGVDIEKGAVDIARLRFWLSLIVDEEKPKALPNLDYKIVVGNSLVSKLGNDIIDIDWSLNTTKDGLYGADLAKQKGDLLRKISKEQKEFFNPDSDKKKLAADIRNLKIDLLIKQLELMVKTQGIETKPTGTGKTITKQTEVYLQTIGWKNSIKDLQKLKDKSEATLHFFDWKLDFPEVMNPALFSDANSNNMGVINAQIIALNKQIDAINLHLEQHEVDAHIIHLQTNVAQSQITIIKSKLTLIEKKISEIFGQITTVVSNIVGEQDLSLGYNIQSINQGIIDINQRVESINPQIDKQNPQVGFDIVIGNPPYGAKLNVTDKSFFQTKYKTAQTVKGIQKGSTDTFTLFIELGHDLTNVGGNLHYIVPISITSSDSMVGVHRFMEKDCSQIKVSSYAVRPQPVFENAVVNTSILYFRKDGKPCEKIYSTKMYRKSNVLNLKKLVDNLEFIDVKNYKIQGRYPKISLDIERKILSKIFINKVTIRDLLKAEGEPIYYRFAGGRYYKVITNYSTGSSAERAINFDKSIANSVGAILSSNLYFWFYQIFSDNLNLKSYEIEVFSIPLDKFNEHTTKKLELVYADYLKDIEKNANVRLTEKYANIDSFKEYKIGKSKHLIDKIDDIICPLYDLTEEEIHFIKNYEINFRLQDE